MNRFERSIRVALFFLLFGGVLPASFAAAPANDDCTSASPLTISTSCSAIPGDLQNANVGTPTSTCGTAYDVWYSIAVPTGTTSVTIKLTTTGAGLSSTNTFFAVYSGPASSPVLVPGTTCTAAGTDLTTTSLSPGNTYYIRVFTTTNPSNGNKWGFTICASYIAPPSNDECSAATTLSAGTAVNGTVWAATASPLIPVGCSTGTPDDDVWYQFNATSSSMAISLSNVGTDLSTSGAIMQLFSGTCGALSSLACSATSALYTTGLTVGNVYYVRVYSAGSGSLASAAGSAFTITASVISPPANDDCANATSLVVGAGTSGSVWFASASSGIPAGCSFGTPDDDVWYKFTATNSKMSVSLSSIGADLSASGTVLQLFSGSCGSLTSVACAGTSTLYVSNLTSGSTYYVRVYSYGSGTLGSSASGSTFTITASVPSTPAPTNVESSRMNEVFQQTILSAAGVLNDPWEVTYGPDGYLWITEAKGYKLYRMDPSTGAKVTVLDVSQNSTFLPASDQGFDVQFSTSQNPWPQGGFAGMAIHPKFMDPVSPKNYIYVSYVHSYVKTVTSPANGGVIFTNRVVRFTYNTTTGKLENPVSLCDTLPGSSDHNSQRMIIAPVNGTDYLFYAQGDMGAGQYTNTYRENKAQITASYEGKILRFNLEADNDAGTLDKWIPNDNPFNGTTQSAVWSTGIRNNQGFAYATINGTGYLYGSSHGPFSDDEINIIEKAKNYGHPNVIGFNDGNYDNAKAGPSASSLPLITSEADYVTNVIGTANYGDPIFSFYPAPKGDISTAGTIQYIYNQVNTGNGANASWPSEAPSGLDAYTNSMIPGWKNSLLAASLKGGKMIRLKLNAAGTAIAASDTVSYFRSVNRFRDVALSPDGKSVFAVIDKSSTTSGPTTGSPIVSACAGCVIKYTFMGYNTVNSRSAIPTSIGVSTTTANSCTPANTITIDASNNNLWVPITGSDGNVVAEIKANGNNLGTVTTSVYINGGSVRENAAKRLFANRNLTITPQTQPSSAVSVRLYLTAAEFAALKSATNSRGNSSGVNAITDLSIYKNSDACGSTMTNTTTVITPTIAEAFGGNYVLQADISSFSSFYFANASQVLPLQLVRFTGTMQNNVAQLNWGTVNETNTVRFEVERSTDGASYTALGNVKASGGNGTHFYTYTDATVSQLNTARVYYRLKMVDEDGSFSFSQVLSFPVSRPSTLTVFPNPVQQTLSVSMSDARYPLTLQVTDLSGRVVYTEKLWRSAATINVGRWKPQVYLLKVLDSSNQLVATQKFEKIN